MNYNQCNCDEGYYGEECQNECPLPLEPTVQFIASENSIEIKIEAEYDTSFH